MWGGGWREECECVGRGVEGRGCVIMKVYVEEERVSEEEEAEVKL